MKKIRRQKFNLSIIKCQLSILLLSLLLSGCGGGNQTSDSAMVRRAQLIGNENLQLKKDLAAKDKQIADLTKQLQVALAKNAEIEQQYAQTKEYLTDCSEQQNAKPVPCEEVEAKYAELYGNLSQFLSECLTKLEKYEAADPNVQPQPDTQ